MTISKILPAQKIAQVILGGQDGLVNTFGVILGVAAASGNIKIVIAGGLAACFAESISMGAVAYTSQKASYDHYLSELEKQKEIIEKTPEETKKKVTDIYREKGFRGKELDRIVELITSNKQASVSIILSEDKNIAQIRRSDVFSNSAIVFAAAIVGSLIPLTPFFFFDLMNSIIASFIFSSIALFTVGYYKGKMTIGKPIRNGLELLIIGLIAAVLGYAIAYAFSMV